MGRYIILTKSGMKKKIGDATLAGVCVVAYNLETRALERFVQAPEGGPLRGPGLRVFDVLDEVRVTPLRDVPEPPQTENRMIPRDSIRSLGRGRLSIRDIALRCKKTASPRYMADPSPWIHDVSVYDHSVEICLARELCFVWAENKKNPQVSFRIGEKSYRSIRVTDPGFETDPDAPPPAPREIPEAYLVVSIPGIPHRDGLYYKFVAAVYPVEPAPEAYAPAPLPSAPPEPPAEAPAPSAANPPVDPPAPAAAEPKTSYRDQVMAQGSTSAYQPWRPEEDAALKAAWQAGDSVGTLSRRHKRTRGAIRSRLRKLDLIQ